MDQYVCACCAEPVYVETEYWMPLAEPAYVDAYIEPAYVDPFLAPVYVEPAPAPVYVEPVYVEPVYVEPVYVEPVYVEPVYIEPAQPIVLPPVSEVGTLSAEVATLSPQVSPAPTDASGLSLQEVLASSTGVGGNPWDSSHVLEMQRMSQVILSNPASPAVTALPTWYSPDQVLNASLNAGMAQLNAVTLQNITAAIRATNFNLMNSGW